MGHLKRTVLISMLSCSLLAPTYVTAASPEKSKTWTARELIEKITESERKIRNWEVHAEYEYQALNGYKVVYDMGYDQGKKRDEVLQT
jgi:hypothetical protein